MSDLSELLDTLDDAHSTLRDIGYAVIHAVESADRWEPELEDDGVTMTAASKGEWIHRDDLLYTLGRLLA